MKPIQAKVGLQQRILPAYRAAFFDQLAEACEDGLGVFAGEPREEEARGKMGQLNVAQHESARNLHLFSGGLYLCWQRGFISWLKNWLPDVLIVEANPRYLVTPFAVRWMRAHQKPVIGWGLGAPASSGRLQNLRLAWRRWFVGQFDALITYSQQGKAEYCGLGFPEERVFVACNAVTPRPIYPPPKRPMKPVDNKPVVLFVGRLQARKRVDLLIRACAELPLEMKPELWIVGDGPVKDELQNYAAGIYSDAHFWGAQEGPALDSLFRQADLFVLPGTGGLAVQQAMSHALPVIVAEADGTQVDLVRPENGWCVPPGDLDKLVDTLQTALKDIPRLRQMGSISYQIVDREINLEKMVKAFGSAINAVLEK